MGGFVAQKAERREDLLPNCLPEAVFVFGQFPIARYAAPHGIVLKTASRRQGGEDRLHPVKADGPEIHDFGGSSVKGFPLVQDETLHHP